MSSSRKQIQMQQLEYLEEESIYNKLLILEHSIEKSSKELLKSVLTKIIDNINNINSIREIVKLYDVDVCREDSRSRFEILSSDMEKVDNEQKIDTTEVELKESDIVIEEHYIGQRRLEKSIISEW